MIRPTISKPEKSIASESYSALSDPYLIWANETNFRDFAVLADSDSMEYFQVAVQTSGENPLPIDAAKQGWPVRGLRAICESRDKKYTIFTGAVAKTDLQLLNDTCDLLELNVARYKNIQSTTIADTKAVEENAELPKLGKRVMAIIDYGCPFANRQFWDFKNNTTRVRYFWDQDGFSFQNDLDNTKADQYWYQNRGFQYGRETNSAVLKELFAQCTVKGILDEQRVYERSNYVELMQEFSSHGAHVMDLAAGQINPMTGMSDDASDADIIFVQLTRDSVNDSSGGSMTMYVLDALKYIFEKTENVEQLVINLSFGSTAGPHDGTSLLERGIDLLIEQRRREGNKSVELVLPAGNHFLANLHGKVSLTQENREAEFLWEVMPDDPTESYLELWCPANSNICLVLTSPSGLKHTLSANELRYISSDNAKLALIRATKSSNGENELVLVALSPTHACKAVNVESGVWSVKVSMNGSEKITVNAWVERDDAVPWQIGQPQCRLLSSRIERQIDAPDVRNDVVKRDQTGNSLAYGRTPIIASGYIMNSMFSVIEEGVALSSISAAGPFNSERSYIAPSDESDYQRGIIAGGNLSGTWVRMDGTSVAAPQVARQLLNDPKIRRIRNTEPYKSKNDLRVLQGVTLKQIF
jgi:Subtilase family